MVELVGKLHPLVLHLPIGILILGICLEGYFLYKKSNEGRHIQSFVYAIAAISALISVATGLALVNGGEYSRDLVSRHKWFAIGLTVLSWALLWLHEKNVRKGKSRSIYYITLGAVAIALVITGHLGGTITHGENFLFQEKEDATANIDQAIIYDDLIQPIFKRKCISCHNPSKLKGDLNMTEYDLLFEGGKNGKVILVDDPMASPLLKRIHLPLEEEEHMPPEGKKQLIDDEIALLQWWLESGSPLDTKIKEMSEFEEYEEKVLKFLSPPELTVFDKLKPPDSLTLLNLKGKAIKVSKLSNEDNGLYANFLNQKDLKTRDVKSLNKVKKYVAHLNFSNSSISDSDLKLINNFTNLEKLELQNTTITSKGINKLKNLNNLKTLNLFNTKIDSSAIPKLLSFPRLQNLYVWQTALTPEHITQMEEEKPTMNIIFNINADIFKDAGLKAPLISAKSDLFKDSIEVSLDLNFKGVNIYYTTDGSDPDSTSILYEKPFVIYNSAEIKTIAMKDSWNPSSVNSRFFVKSGKKAAGVKLVNSPHSRYKKIGAKNLNNLKLGSLLFSDGEWIGYEGEDAIINIDFGSSMEVASMTIGVLENTGSYIFYPKGIEVLGTNDNSNYDQLAKIDYEIAVGPNGSERKNLSINLNSGTYRYLELKIKSHLKNPEWHAAPGAKCWIFIDEIIIN